MKKASSPLSYFCDFVVIEWATTEDMNLAALRFSFRIFKISTS